jgi:hypothetical protein
MRFVAQYRSQAKECRKLGKRTVSPDDKLIFELIAQSWERLADLRQRDIEAPDIDA